MDIPEIGGPQQPEFILPDLRLFRVRRWNMSKEENVPMFETVEVFAHSVQYSDSGVLAFFALSLADGPEGKYPHNSLKRAFSEWYDLEEVEIPKSSSSVLQ